MALFLFRGNMQILVVCTGNICRSPMGQIVLQKYLSTVQKTDIRVISAGVSSEEEGNDIDWRAQEVLLEYGYALPEHRAHRATNKELMESDLILVMTRQHQQALMRRAEILQIPTDKIKLWREVGNCVSTSGSVDVNDPWYGGKSGFYETLKILETGAVEITKCL